jgi:hypothetical protein
MWWIVVNAIDAAIRIALKESTTAYDNTCPRNDEIIRY